jgi:F0F1-type ATP synthase assembly protein I
MASNSFAQNAMVIAELDSQQILIGDQINLDISVEFTHETPLVWPVFTDTITGQIEIIQSLIPDTTKKESGETVIHQRFVITSFDTGFIVLPPIHFIFNNDSSQMLSTEPLLIFVSDIPVEMEADIKEIKAPYDAPFNWKKWLMYGLIILLVLGLIIEAIILIKRRKQKPVDNLARPKPKRPAHEIALEKLEELRQKKLSDEAISALKQYGLEELQLAQLKKLLQMSDLAKFAKYTPVGNENEQCFEIAKVFVSGTMVMPLDEPNTDEKPKAE